MIMPNVKVQSSNQIENSNDQQDFLTFNHLALICHLDFDI